MIYGYARVSTKAQEKDGNSLPEQTEAILQRYPDAVIIPEAMSGAKERPKFIDLLEKLQSGDTLVVTKLDRFCRTTKEGLGYIDVLQAKGVNVHILNMGLIEDSPMGRLIVTNLFAFAEFERSMIRERTMTGRAYKKANDPEYKEGRKNMEVPRFAEFVRMVTHGELSVVESCKQLGISRTQWYRLCKKN